MRYLIFASTLYTAVCLGLLVRTGLVALRTSATVTRSVAHTEAASSLPDSAAARWFAAAKPTCNALEVETRMTSAPPPEGAEGSGYAAACWAMAGKLPKASNLLQLVAPAERRAAVAIVFHIGHAVADGGDEKSAGPLLKLVLEFDPENALALYHVAMSSPIEERVPLLRRFLALYSHDDETRRNAQRTLDYLAPS